MFGFFTVAEAMPLRFILISGFAAVINLIVGQVLYGMMGFDQFPYYGISVCLAFCIGMMVSFFLNRRFTFLNSGRPLSRDASRFLVVSLGGVLLTATTAQVILLSAPEYLNITLPQLEIAIPSKNTAHAIAVFITAFYSYYAHKFISFGPSKGTHAQAGRRKNWSRDHYWWRAGRSDRGL